MSSAYRARLRSARVAASLLALAAAASAAPRAPLAPYEIFRFSAGSTLFAPPGVGKDGAVYVGSGEGYVHALSSDGGYRWSYTVKGRVVAAPVEDPATGRVFVVTSDARLYALEADSHLRWVFPLRRASFRWRRRARSISSVATTTFTASRRAAPWCCASPLPAPAPRRYRSRAGKPG
jgi:hypothetical protein